MGLSAQHMLLLLVIGLLLLGRGKISELMGDVAKRIKSFKHGLREEDGVPISTELAARKIENKTEVSEHVHQR